MWNLRRYNSSKLTFINFTEHLKKRIIFDKLNMWLSPNHFVNWWFFLHIKPNLNSVITFYPWHYIVSHWVYLLIFSLSHDSCWIMGNEFIFWRWNYNDFVEPSNLYLFWQPHQKWIFFCYWLKVELFNILDLIYFR